MRILALEINGGPEIGPGPKCSKARKCPRGAEAWEKGYDLSLFFVMQIEQIMIIELQKAILNEEKLVPYTGKKSH